MRTHLMIGLVITAALSAGLPQRATADSPADYVALGSSFAAGPDVGRPDPSGPPPCARSLDNYPHKLAARRGLTLDDRTCSGAKTEDVVSRHQFGLPPQIDAIGPNTRLVTITIGGNDLSYLGDLTAASCRSQGGVNCQPSPLETLDARYEALRQAFASLLAAARARAPAAQIVVVDYVTIAPAAGACPDRTPLSEADMSWARDRATRLRHITADSAKTAGAALVRASDLTVGHDVCAAEPWVNGWHDIGPSGRRRAPYHPRIEAMDAIADALDQLLPASLTSSK